LYRSLFSTKEVKKIHIKIPLSFTLLFQ
jgi:hypothetical protein